jgi:PAS domain S-box-containing protein
MNQIAEALAQAVFAAANDAMLVVDENYGIAMCNAAAEAMLGRDGSQLSGMNLRDLRAPAERDALDSQMRSTVANNGGRWETAYERPDGSVVAAEVSTRPFTVASRTWFLHVVRDISDRKRGAAKILRLSRMHALLNEINSASIRLRERQALFDQVCAIAVKTGGLRAAWIGVIDGESDAVQTVARAGSIEGYLGSVHIASRPSKEEEGPFVRALRENRHVLSNDLARDPAFAPWREAALVHGYRSVGAFPLRVSGRPFGAFVFYADTTDFFDAEETVLLDSLANDVSFAVEAMETNARREAAERALQSSEGRFRAVFEQAAVGICVVDSTNRILQINGRFCALLGYSAEELTESGDCVALTYPEDRVADSAAVGRLRHGEASVSLEKRYLHKDGQPVWARLTLSLLQSQEGEAEVFLGIVEDIAGRKKAEADLRDWFTISPDLMFVANFDGTMEQISPSWTTCLGWTAEELRSTPLLELVAPEDREATLRARAVLAQGRPLLDFENRYRCKDGSYRWLAWSYVSSIETRRVFGAARDITERRQHEEQLRLLEASVARLNDIVVITEAEPFDEPGPRIVFVNDAFVRRTGYTREEVLGRSPRFLQGPKTQRAALDAMRASMKRWQPVRVECINYTKSGEEFWLEMEIVPVADAKGWFTHWVAIERDVTERKQIEEALRKSERQLQELADKLAAEKKRLLEAQAVAKIGSWETDLATGDVEWSDETHRVFETEPRSFQPTHQKFLLLVHPDDRAMVDEAFLSSFAVHTPCAITHRLLMADDRIKFVEERWQSFFDEKGRPTRAVGTSRDITEQITAEAKLRAAEHQLHALVSRLHTVREEEAKRIARELHDDLGQHLTALNMEIAALKITPARDPLDLHGRLTTMDEIVDHTIEVVQKISGELRLGQLDLLGLPAAIEWHLQEFQKRSGLRCTFSQASEIVLLPDAVATAVFRVVQEALTNIARHAQATEVEIGMAAAHGNLRVEVRDNGRGITPTQLADHTAYGLLGMRERVEALGGKITMSGVNGGGTTVVVTLPISA